MRDNKDAAFKMTIAAQVVAVVTFLPMTFAVMFSLSQEVFDASTALFGLGIVIAILLLIGSVIEWNRKP